MFGVNQYKDSELTLGNIIKWYIRERESIIV